MKKSLHMMIGGTGTGKSTFVKKLERELNIPTVSADEIQKRNKTLTDLEVDKTTLEKYMKYLKSDSSFILDGKCLKSDERKRLIADAKKSDFDVVGYDFGCGTVVSFLRRLVQPGRFSRKYWEEVYDYDRRTYESPELDEGFEKIVFPPK